jgi:bifunctional enzyme CysN/CysC
MSTQDALIAQDIEGYLHQHEVKDLLRFITCGSVDDGKSTLIGRLLFDSKMLFEDQIASLTSESKTFGTTGGDLDLALLVDGLAAEREQGITIDVAYRFFTTDRRKFIVADTPGHEQYTRNMATGASTADLAVLLVDARHGIMTQTRRHSYIVSLLGIRTVVVAVNKMDLVDYSRDAFDEIVAEYQAFAKDLGFERIVCIPMSALKGENVTSTSPAMDWYHGPALLPFLETVDVSSDLTIAPFRMPVQWVNRPNLDFRGYSGTIAAGTVAPGDRLTVLPSGQSSTVARVVTQDGDLDKAVAGQAITLTLTDEIDISRGDVLCISDSPAQVSDQVAAHVVWMSDEPLLPGRQYLIRTGTAQVAGSVSEIKHKINVNTLEHQAGKRLELNEVALCNLSLDHAIAFDPYRECRDTGAFIIVDRFTNSTVGAGMIEFGLRRASNIHWQKLEVNKEARASLKGQKPCVLWFTGLSGAGKSTVANLVEKKLHAMGRHTTILDGDNVRHGLNKDIGFTAEDRVENIRRVGEVAKLMVDAGLITLVSFISPFRSERQMARAMVEHGEFIEVFVDTPLEICEQRDPKGLYAKARRGEIKNFTGIDSPYERPENAEVHLKVSAGESAEQLAERVIAQMEEQGLL